MNDTQLNVGAAGDKIRDFDDGTRKWPASFIAYGTVSDPGPIGAPTVVQGYATPFPIGISFASAQIDPRAVRALTTSDQVSATLLAGVQLIGQVAAAQQTNILYKGTTANIPVFLAISVAASGRTPLVAAQGAGKVIKVLKISLFAPGGANTIGLQDYDGASTYTDLLPATAVLANQSIQLSYCPVGNFATLANHALVINNGSANAITGCMTYVVE